MKYVKVKREKSTSDVRHYVRNADLMPAIAEAKRQGGVTRELSDLFSKIAENCSRKYNFAGYSFRADMVASAITNLTQNALKFDNENYDNPFAYYTTAIYNSFFQFIANEKKHATIRDALLVRAGANPSYGYQQDGDINTATSDDIHYRDEKDFKDREIDLSLGDNTISDFSNVKVQYRNHIPGPVTTYGPGDFTICEKTGNYIRKTA